MSWREVAAIGEEIRANRKQLRPLVAVRCPTAPSPILAAVYFLQGERWLWTVGDKPSRAELEAEGVDLAEWPRVAASIRPLDRGWPITGPTVATCRKCRLSWLIDVASADEQSAELPSRTRTVLVDQRFVRPL